MKVWKSKFSRKALHWENSDTLYLKNQDKILHELETNKLSSKQRSAHKTGIYNEEINKLIWEWFKDMS